MSELEEVQQLIYRYTDACNHRDWPRVMTTFAEDGVWEVRGNPIAGRAAIGAAMSGFVGQMAYFTQIASAPVVSLAGDRATARTTIHECGKFADRDEALEVLGYYEDEIVRRGGEWQFSRRKFTSFGLHRYALLPDAPLG